MKVNPILASAPVRPVGRMKVSCIPLPVKVEAYEPHEDPAPDWLVALGIISLGILAVISIVLWG